MGIWRRRRRAQSAAARAAGLAAFEEVEARAARLGITKERVLEEYGRIAFANLLHLLDKSKAGLTVKPTSELTEEDMAAISELVEAAGSGRPYRIRFYDKEAALDAIGRYLGMLPKAEPEEDEPAPHDSEDPREFLKRELARIRARDADK